MLASETLWLCDFEKIAFWALFLASVLFDGYLLQAAFRAP
jgi:hypothetical protein